MLLLNINDLLMEYHLLSSYLLMTVFYIKLLNLRMILPSSNKTSQLIAALVHGLANEIQCK